MEKYSISLYYISRIVYHFILLYRDDLNELFDRLRHNAMSTETGNIFHGNEILSIVEELREAGFIKGTGNSRFKSLLQ